MGRSRHTQHVMENAPCNVIVIKGFFLAEEHGASVAEVQKLEEQERQRRIQEFGKKGEQTAGMIKHLRELEEERLRRGGAPEQYTGRLGDRIERLQSSEGRSRP